MAVRHFLSLLDLSADELKALLKRASELKIMQRNGLRHEVLTNRTLAMVFEKSSTRTRVSFETAMIQLGGGPFFCHLTTPNWGVVNRSKTLPGYCRGW